MTVLVAVKDFTMTHEMLANMMTREGGVIKWSTTHNSPLEPSKLALIDFAHRSTQREHLALTLPNITVEPTDCTKYLGIMIDQHLEWKTQHNYAIEKGSKWAAQIRRIIRPHWGITPKYARHLYMGVALPRILYGTDIWCSILQGKHPGATEKGTAKVQRKLTSIQRTGAITIIGALCTSPMDTLNACAFLPPMAHTLEKWSLRVAV